MNPFNGCFIYPKNVFMKVTMHDLYAYLLCFCYKPADKPMKLLIIDPNRFIKIKIVTRSFSALKYRYALPCKGQLCGKAI